MMKINKRALWILISFAIALGMWCAVMDVRNPEQEYQYKSIVVQLEDEELGPDLAGLTVLQGEGQVINVTVRGRRNDLILLDSSEIVATASLAGLTQAGDYYVAVSVQLPNSDSIVSGLSTKKIPVKLEKMTTVSIPIRVLNRIQTQSGYVAGTPALSSQSVTVTGPEAEVNYLSYAQVVLEGDGFTSAMETDAQLQLYNQNDEQVKNQYITTDIQTVHVQVPVYAVKTVPLVTQTTGELSEDLYLTELAMGATEVQIYGSTAALDAVDELKLSPVDLSAITGSSLVTCSVELPSGVSLTGSSNTVSVSVMVDRYMTVQVTVAAFDFVNVPQGYEAETDLTSLDVTVRVPTLMAAKLYATTLVGELDLSGWEEGQTQGEAPLQITGEDLPDAVALAENYTASITLTEAS